MAMTATDIRTIPTPKREWSRYRHPESTIRFAVILGIWPFSDTRSLSSISIYTVSSAHFRGWPRSSPPATSRRT